MWRLAHQLAGGRFAPPHSPGGHAPIWSTRLLLSSHIGNIAVSSAGQTPSDFSYRGQNVNVGPGRAVQKGKASKHYSCSRCSQRPVRLVQLTHRVSPVCQASWQVLQDAGSVSNLGVPAAGGREGGGRHLEKCN